MTKAARGAIVALAVVLAAGGGYWFGKGELSKPSGTAGGTGAAAKGGASGPGGQGGIQATPVETVAV